jgi:hypothetical protein
MVTGGKTKRGSANKGVEDDELSLYFVCTGNKDGEKGNVFLC